jgi:hypothetical protein
MPKLKDVKVSIKLPWFGEIAGTWEPNEEEKLAAWEMYVELITRISVAELKAGEGLLREALSSLYSLFDTTRKILRQHGPTVAKPKGKGDLSFGYLSVAILNAVLRPVLAKWHPQLLDYESKKPASISPLEYEKQWPHNEELRKVLNQVRTVLVEYADILAEVAEVPSLIVKRPLQSP